MPVHWNTRRARRFACNYDRNSGRIERAWAAAYRRDLLAGVTGVVLDLGAGTGANLRHLRRASHVVAVEPAPAMRRQLATKAAGLALSVSVLGAQAEHLPLRDATVDVVICTLVLCTVADLSASLAELRRVLRPGGLLVLFEHVSAGGLRGWVQRRVSRPWRWLYAGCHPGRDTASAVREAGFILDAVRIGRSPRPRPPVVGPYLTGLARRA
jgi:ubiquinone/menaquinone biosynthesis C-methylase UbiE